MVSVPLRTSPTICQRTAADDYSRARIMMASIGIMAVALGMLIAYLATRSITRPLHAAVQLARVVASGDLTTQIEIRTTDETGQLLEALAAMSASLPRGNQ